MTMQDRSHAYPEGHFEIYVGDAFERVLADQLEFLERNLLKVSG
jgi:uncharacterized protein